jgi:hypothetical protein
MDFVQSFKCVESESVEDCVARIHTQVSEHVPDTRLADDNAQLVVKKLQRMSDEEEMEIVRHTVVWSDGTCTAVHPSDPVWSDKDISLFDPKNVVWTATVLILVQEAVSRNLGHELTIRQGLRLLIKPGVLPSIPHIQKERNHAANAIATPFYCADDDTFFEISWPAFDDEKNFFPTQEADMAMATSLAVQARRNDFVFPRPAGIIFRDLPIEYQKFCE